MTENIHTCKACKEIIPFYVMFPRGKRQYLGLGAISWLYFNKIQLLHGKNMKII